MNTLKEIEGLVDDLYLGVFYRQNTRDTLLSAIRAVVEQNERYRKALHDVKAGAMGGLGGMTFGQIRQTAIVALKETP